MKTEIENKPRKKEFLGNNITFAKKGAKPHRWGCKPTTPSNRLNRIIKELKISTYDDLAKSIKSGELSNHPTVGMKVFNEVKELIVNVCGVFIETKPHRELLKNTPKKRKWNFNPYTGERIN